jgi:RHS repeat-associated protein
MRYPDLSLLSRCSLKVLARVLRALRVPVCFMMLACVAFPLPLVAQTSTITPDVLVTNATQTPIEGVGHDYIHDLSETVNPQNGQVSIRIAGPSPHERGPNLPHYAYLYDTSGRESMTFSPELVQCSSPDPGYAPAECDAVVTGPSPAYGLGTPAPTPPLLNTIFQVFSSQSYTSPQVPGNVNAPVTYGCAYYAYSYFDSQGGLHNLNLHVLNNQSTTPEPGCSGLGYETNYFGGDSSIKADCQQNVSCSAVDATTSSGLVLAGLFGNTSIEDSNGNGSNGTGRPASYTYTTVQGHPQPPGQGQQAGYVALSTITLPGVSGTYTYNYSTFSRSGSVGFSASVNSYSTGGGWCQLNELGNMTQTTSFADVSSLLLPNGQSYTFGYDGKWGLVNSITYPTGGKVTYTWGVNSLSESYNANTPPIWNGILLNGQQNCYFEYDLPVVTKRVVDFDGTHPALEQDFAYSTAPGTNGFWSTKTTTVTTKDLVRGTTTGVTKYNYIPMFPPLISTGTSSKSVIPHESTVVYQDGAGNTLRTIVKVWLGVDLLGAECEILDNGMVSGKFYQYQQVPSPAYVWSGGMSDQVTDLAEYDYTQGVTSTCVQPSSATAPARETKTQYATIPSSTLWQPAESEPIPQTNDRPSVIQIYDHGTLIAETDFAYDQTSVVSVSPTAYDHDETNLGPSQAAGRGNATTITKKCIQNCSTNSVITAQYDETGQIVGVTDANGNTTTLSYADDYSIGGTPPGNTNTYVTTITRPITNGINHISSFAYHYTFGELTSATDENSQVTTYTYNDTWGRPTLGNASDGGQIQKVYNDSAPSPTVTTCQLISGTAGATCSATSPPTGWKTTLDTLDGVGHLVQTALVSDPTGTDYSGIAYDGLGRTYQKYNPTRCSTPTTNCGETTWGMTTYTYDALNRTTKVAEPDGSAVSTAYSGNTAIVTDEAGKQRTSTTDAFGRLTAVVEAPGVSGLKFTTQYQYDALNDLLCAVQQGTSTGTFTNCASAPATWHPRSFVYDSLSRLTSATNPESGKISYAYDANSNLITKIALSPNQVSTGTATVTTSYTYDALNRLTGKAYSDTYTQNPATPSVTYGYDGVLLSCPDPVGFAGKSATNGIGRRTAMCFSVGSKAWQYDPMGRIYTQNDRFVGLVPPLYEYNISTNSAGVPSISTDTDYRYDLNGDLGAVYYPGQGIPTEEFYTTESGAGRIIAAGDATYHALISGIYTPDGQLTTGTVCNNTCNASNTYNNRLQPVLISAATTSGTPILNLTYDFNLGNGTTGSDNGNVIQIANGKNSNRTQNFVYDPLNRIWQAYTNGSNWGETYSPNTYAAGTVFSAANAGIDAWGNLANRSPVTGKTNYEPLSCAANTSNQLNTCYTYDAAGNLTKNGTTTYTYDAENRLIATGGDSYIYDGDGQRVEKCTEGTAPGTCSSTATGTFYWLHAGGGTLAESDLGGNWTAAYGLIHGQIIDRVDLPANVVHYYFHDRLNSTNVVTDIDGNILNESDYYPYGGEIVITSGDSNRYKFTGKERDTESGLDMFGARYYGSGLGRFMTPDWAAKPIDVPYANFGNPQSLNLYSYVVNNPTTTRDPDGHAFGLDDLVGAVTGAVVGVGVELIKDVATGQKITAGGVISAGVGGAVFGEGVVNAPETGGLSVIAAGAAKGAIEGAVLNGIQQGVDLATGAQKQFSGTSMAVSVAAGAVSGGLVSKLPEVSVPGISSGQGNMKSVAQGVSTKIADGTVSSMSLKTAVKGAIGGQVANAGKTATEAATDAAGKKACGDKCQ